MAGDQGTAQQEDAQEAETVGLEYQPAVEDYRSALRVRTRISKAARPMRWTCVLAAVLVAVHVLLSLSNGASVDWRLVGLLAFCAVLLLALPRLQARQVYRVCRRQGTHRVTVADTGLTMVNATSSSTVVWTAMPRYRETRELFVLFSDDRNASCFTVLPKRGARGPADVDRLRELLDRHLTRV